MRTRIPADVDVLILSLGWDTLAGDPVAAESERMELVPEDFGRMRRLLADWMAGYEDRGAGERLKKRQMLVIQEGGYKLDDIPAAAQAFWTGGKHAE